MSVASAQTHLLIGLTGGIGSGKTTVSNMFAELGARIIDTDEISKQLTQAEGVAISAIRDTFGAEYIDKTGALDRPKMRQLVFSNTNEKQRLEAILHPLILNKTKQIALSPTPLPYTIVVVPLLFEVPGYRGWLHRTLVVDCPEEIQITRTMQRSGLDSANVIKIMAQQMPRLQRTALADDAIENSIDLKGLFKDVAQLHQRYLTMIARSD
ncbi:MAG: dephospho-CoA kinase [Gallionellaceae bacterium]|jgi:dephospho-CoA kinase